MDGGRDEQEKNVGINEVRPGSGPEKPRHSIGLQDVIATLGLWLEPETGSVENCNRSSRAAVGELIRKDVPNGTFTDCVAPATVS
jgi:hypothetical protein